MTSEAQTIDWGTPRTREITWYSPATITAAAAELSNDDEEPLHCLMH